MKKEIKIRFTSKERQMLKKLNKKYKLDYFDLSALFKVNSRTIERWIKGDNVPPYSTRIMIASIYEEYKTKGAK